MSKLKLLLAEDDPEHQELLLLALQRDPQSPADVRAVDTGDKLLKELRTDRFDCVIVDFNLPDYSADDLIRTAKDDLGDTPVIAISSSDAQAIVIESLRSGIVDFVPKSQAVSSDALLQSVKRAVSAARLQQAERRHHERRERCLAIAAETDPLTGLYNRRYFQRAVEDGRWSNDRRASTGCLMVDIDHFKAINDTHGHNAGDQVLGVVAKAIGQKAGGGASTFRWGGEEFLILKTAPLTEAWVLAEDIRQAIERLEVRVNDKPIPVTVSVGLAHGPTESLSPAMVEMADQALYLAKTAGRNRVCTWQMVDLKRLSEQFHAGAAQQPESCRKELLQQLASSMGPTQWQHLTSHSTRVSRAAEGIGQRMGLSREQVEQIRLAGLYHDLGKCMIPEDLLAQPRRLTDGEWRVMSTHASIGADVGAWLGLREPIRHLVRHHHARYDAGAGNSPLGARVLCAADALVTMLTGRPYARARSVDDAIQEMNVHKGRQFDPQVVDAVGVVDFSYGIAA